jgi:4'-phosphopantetheinyl transferase EntD
VASISHTAGYCAVVAARAANYGGLGLDVERAGEVEPELVDMIALPAEARILRAADAGRTALFSAKEAVYKCVFPALGLDPDFHDVSTGAPAGGPFRAKVAVAGEPVLFVDGLFLRTAGLVVSLAWLPVSPP